MRYLSIKTFIDYNPDWKVFLWTPVNPKLNKYWQVEKGHQEIDLRNMKDFFPELKKLPLIIVPVDFDKYGFQDYQEVHRNDYIRLYALYYYGGLWSDMDIIYFRSVESLKVNLIKNKSAEMFVCISPEYGHSTGFNLAAPKSKFCEKLFNKLFAEYKAKNYQCWGPDLWNKYFKKLNSIPGGVEIGMDAVYAHNCYIVKELLNGAPERFTRHSIGCHWYGGNSLWGEWMNKTNGGLNNLTNNLISKLIKNVNKRIAIQK